MNKQQLLKRLDREWVALQESYAGLSGAQLEQPGVTGDWSIKSALTQNACPHRRQTCRISSHRRW